MTFSPGDRVHLAGLGTGVVREVRGRERYAIEIKGRVVVAFARDLRIADGARPRGSPRKNPDEERPRARRGTAPGSLDLHGKTTVEAIELVEAFVNEALLDGLGEVRIIHGRGSGRVMTAVHAYLRRLPAAAAFRIDPRNAGVTIVSFA